MSRASTRPPRSRGGLPRSRGRFFLACALALPCFGAVPVSAAAPAPGRGAEALTGPADPAPVGPVPEAGMAAEADDEIILRREGKRPGPGTRDARLGARKAGSARSLVTGGACLGAVLLGIVGLAWLFRRFAPGAAAAFKSPCLEVLGRTFLDRQRSVCLLRVGDRVLVVGCSATSLDRLAEIDDPEEAAQLCRQARSATGTGTLGRNPLGLLGGRSGFRGGRKSFLRSLREVTGGAARTEDQRAETAPRGSEALTAEPPVAETGLGALQDEAVRLREQLETMRRAL